MGNNTEITIMGLGQMQRKWQDLSNFKRNINTKILLHQVWGMRIFAYEIKENGRQEGLNKSLR